MTAPQQTRCPQCQTVFRVTPEQLAARGGRVRCGVCASAFQADQNLIDAGGTNTAETDAATTEPITAPTAVAEYVGEDLPLMNDFPLAPRRRVPTALWLVGGLLLLVTVAGQVTYFYAAELARDARLKPWLARYCERFGCSVQPRGSLPIDLAQTSVSPHPQFENALRLDAVLINRAAAPQPYPRLEISLTDSEGRMLARRQFTAAQYLRAPAGADGLPPGRPLRAQVDVTNPDGRAVGYEIRLVREDNE